MPIHDKYTLFQQYILFTSAALSLTAAVYKDAYRIVCFVCNMYYKIMMLVVNHSDAVSLYRDINSKHIVEKSLKVPFLGR